MFKIVATVLTVYGIETIHRCITSTLNLNVATVLTVYGIETMVNSIPPSLQGVLQQYLPFTVLKHRTNERKLITKFGSCNSTYRLRY